MGFGNAWSQREIFAASKTFLSFWSMHAMQTGKRSLHCSIIRVTKKLTNAIFEEKQNGHKYPSRSVDDIIQRDRKARSKALKFEGIVRSIKARKPTNEYIE